MLVALATADEPDKANNAGDHRDWLSHVCLALEGIAELGDSSVRESIRPLIESKHANIRKAAVRALVWTSRRESLDTLREAVALTRAHRAQGGRTVIEYSGGATLDTVRAYAECGVDRISVGSITKHVHAVDLSMRLLQA